MDKDDPAHFRKLNPDLLGTRSTGSLPSKRLEDGSHTDAKAWAIDEARTFTGMFQKDDAYDPEVYSVALVALFSEYPEHIVKKTTSVNGMVAEHLSPWLPSIGQVRIYLEDKIRPEREHLERQARIDKQLKDREEWLAERTPEEKERRLKLAEDWLTRRDPRAKQLVESMLKRNPEEGLKYLQEASAKQFARECKAAGIDPATATVSPSLKKLLDDQQKAREAIPPPNYD